MSLYQQVCLLFVGRWFYSDLYELQDLSIFTKPALHAWTKSVCVCVYVCVCVCVCVLVWPKDPRGLHSTV